MEMENIDFTSQVWFTDLQNKIEYRLLELDDLNEEYFLLLGQLTTSPYPVNAESTPEQ
jgi:hypothetical protein